VKLVASDLDGTLLRSDGTVSARSRAAIASVEAAGATFVMVTGRPPRWMRSIAEESGHRGLAICANGAIVYDLHTDEVVEHFLLPAAVAVEVAHQLRAQIPDVAFAAEHHERAFAHEAGYKPRWDSGDPRITTTIEELLQDDVVKLLARHPSLGPDELLEQAVAAVGDAVTVTHSSTDGLLEISAQGISKATGLALVADRQAVDATDVVAFGDMPNDLPMLEWAGIGIAVANAHPWVLERADEITASNDDDGVAEALTRWF
jgi:Cof subfamily protein (haloacid dehalogenase superfamily)